MQSNVVYSLGKSAENNWEIYKESKPTDTIFHLDKFSSPYVITNASIEELTKKEIQTATELCKSKSKYKNLKNIGVMYTPISNTKLGDTIGSFVVRKNRLVHVVYI